MGHLYHGYVSHNQRVNISDKRSEYLSRRNFFEDMPGIVRQEIFVRMSGLECKDMPGKMPTIRCQNICQVDGEL